MTKSCDYCQQWNAEHPEAQRTACAPCDICGAPGHIGAHPRQPVSLCLCEQHWQTLSSPGWHFELYQLIYLLIGGLALLQVWRLFF